MWVRVCVCVRVCVWCSVPWEVHGCGGVVVVVVTGGAGGWRGKGEGEGGGEKTGMTDLNKHNLSEAAVDECWKCSVLLVSILCTSNKDLFL